MGIFTEVLRNLNLRHLTSIVLKVNSVANILKVGLRNYFRELFLEYAVLFPLYKQSH